MALRGAWFGISPGVRWCMKGVNVTAGGISSPMVVGKWRIGG
jgi:hypothetical protein